MPLRQVNVRADKQTDPTTGEQVSVVVERSELQDAHGRVIEVVERTYHPAEANALGFAYATAVARARLGMVDDAPMTPPPDPASMTEDEWLTLINAKSEAEWYAAMEALKAPRGGKYPADIQTRARTMQALFQRLTGKLPVV